VTKVVEVMAKLTFIPTAYYYSDPKFFWDVVHLYPRQV
jgi:hypothetical protein